MAIHKTLRILSESTGIPIPKAKYPTTKRSLFANAVGHKLRLMRRRVALLRLALDLAKKREVQLRLRIAVLETKINRP